MDRRSFLSSLGIYKRISLWDCSRVRCDPGNRQWMTHCTLREWTARLSLLLNLFGQPAAGQWNRLVAWACGLKSKKSLDILTLDSERPNAVSAHKKIWIFYHKVAGCKKSVFSMTKTINVAEDIVTDMYNAHQSRVHSRRKSRCLGDRILIDLYRCQSELEAIPTCTHWSWRLHGWLLPLTRWGVIYEYSRLKLTIEPYMLVVAAGLGIFFYVNRNRFHSVQVSPFSNILCTTIF